MHSSQQAINSTPPEIIQHLHSLLFSDDFKDRHRVSEADFTRNTPLSFERICLILSNSMQCTYTQEIRRSFEALEGENFDLLGIPDKSAFSHARKKIKHSAFKELNSELLRFGEEQYDEMIRVWKGYRLIGLDGSTLQLPDTPEIREHFDPYANPEDIPHARISEYVDVLNKIRLDCHLAPITTGEREMMRQQIDKISMHKDALVLTDRGYACHWYLQLALVVGITFCARVKLDQCKEVIDFVESGIIDGEITIYPKTDSFDTLKDEGLEPVPITVRAVRIELPTGETEILLTNLSQDTFSVDELDLLYSFRWGSESNYRHEKQLPKIENFSGKRVEAIYQDYYAMVFIQNLVAILALPAHEVIAKHTAHCEHKYQLNWASAARTMRDYGVKLLGLIKDVGKTLRKVFINLGEDLTIVRFGRIFERKKKNPARKNHMSYKPIG